MSCPTFELLLQALLAPGASAEVDAHLRSGCDRCEARWRLVDRLRAALARGLLPPVPPAVRERTLDLVANAAGVVGGADRGSGVLHARLVADTGRAPALALRGPGAGGRHRVYAAGPFELDVALVSSSVLVGQLVSTDDEERPFDDAVCVLAHRRRVRQVPLDADGWFRFEDAALDDAVLLVELDDGTLIVAGLEPGGDAPRGGGGDGPRP